MLATSRRISLILAWPSGARGTLGSSVGRLHTYGYAVANGRTQEALRRLRRRILRHSRGTCRNVYFPILRVVSGAVGRGPGTGHHSESQRLGVSHFATRLGHGLVVNARIEETEYGRLAVRLDARFEVCFPSRI